MKIIFITQFLPFPLDHGGVIVTDYILKRLKRRRYEIVLFSFANNYSYKKNEDIVRRNGITIGKTIINRNIRNESIIYRLLCLFKNILSIKPYNVERFYHPDMAKAIYKYFNYETIDELWIDHLSMAQYIPNNYKGKTTLVTHNIDSQMYKSMFMKDSFIRWRIFAFYEYIKYYFYELITYKKFNKIYTISEVDKSYLSIRFRYKDIKLLPLRLFKENKLKRAIQKNTMLFIGSLCWYPNKDGIYWFLKKIYPAILKQIPDIQFWIVGQLPRRFIFPKLKGVHFFGYQKSLKSFYSKASIFIVPIRYGSGIRIKLLQALTYKIPIITTSQGIEGIKLNKDQRKKITIADNENEFVQAFYKLK